MLKRSESYVEANRMILKSEEGEIETRIFAEPEAKRNVESERAIEIDAGARSISLRGTSGFTDHIIPSLPFIFSDGIIGPDFEPFSSLFINFLFSNFKT
jgi:hypothetical protein